MKRFSSAQPDQGSSTRRSFLCGVVGLGAMATSLTACSGAGPTLYTLAVVPSQQPQAGGPRYVEVRLPTIASGLDRDRIVTKDTGYQLTVSKNDAWGDSLAGQVSRALAADLAQRLPGTAVFAENDAVTTQPEAYVELSITRFSEGPDGRAEIEAALSIQAAEAGAPAGGTPFYLQRLRLQGAASSGSVSLVRELSQLVGNIADVAATQLRLLPVRVPQAASSLHVPAPTGAVTR